MLVRCQEAVFTIRAHMLSSGLVLTIWPVWTNWIGCAGLAGWSACTAGASQAGILAGGVPVLFQLSPRVSPTANTIF